MIVKGYNLSGLYSNQKCSDQNQTCLELLDRGQKHQFLHQRIKQVSVAALTIDKIQSTAETVRQNNISTSIISRYILFIYNNPQCSTEELFQLNFIM